MSERTLDEAQKTVEVTEEGGHSETTESEETAEAVSEEESLEALLPTLNEKQRTEYTTLKKKSQDFDGLAAKKRKIDVARLPVAKAPAHMEESIRAVLYKDNEKKALRESINPKSDFFIPELVEDKNFNAIVSYLPRSVDRSSPEAIHKALTLATRMWKEDNGEGSAKKEKPEAELVATRGAAGGGSERPEAVKKGRTFLKKVPSLDDWYKK